MASQLHSPRQHIHHGLACHAQGCTVQSQLVWSGICNMLWLANTCSASAAGYEYTWDCMQYMFKSQPFRSFQVLSHTQKLFNRDVRGDKL